MSAIFPLTGNEQRGNYPLNIWAQNYDAFHRWAQMSFIVAIAGYLETFLAQVCGAALESCPAIMIGGSREIEGVSLLKKKSEHNFFDRIEGIIRGDWSSRASAYENLFGTRPFEIEISGLEGLRKLRNDAGHAFGREISSLKELKIAIPGKLHKITESQMNSWLHLADRVAVSIETDLGNRFVGSYEALRLYHNWLPNAPTGESPKARMRLFNRYVAKVLGHPLGDAYVYSVIKYYEKC